MSELYTLIRDVVYTNTKTDSTIQTFYPKLEWVMDFKKVALNEKFLREFSKAFYERVLSRYNSPIQIAGMEAGALPLLAALRLTFPKQIQNAFYFRKSRKKHDLTKQIEGEYVPNLPLILVDDIINAGSTIVKELRILEEQNIVPVEIFSILRFRDSSYYGELFGQTILVTSLFSLDDFSQDLNLHNFPLEKNTTAESYCTYTPTWKVTLGMTNHYHVLPKSSPIADEKNIYIGTDEGYLFAIDKTTGDKKWEFKTHFTRAQKGIYSSPALYKNSLFFGAYDGNLYCLDILTGKARWVSFEGDFIGSSPEVAGDLGYVFIGVEFGLIFKRGGIVALDVATGRVLWIDRNIPDYVHASPAYSKKYNVVVCGANDGVVYAFDAKTGKRKWEYKTQGEVKYKPLFDEDAGTVVVGSFDGGLYLLRVSDGSLIHRFEARSGFYSTPVQSGHMLIAGSLDKCVYAYDLKEYKTVWSVETNGRIFASPVICDGAVYIGSNDGCLYVLDLLTGKRLAHIQLTERIVNRAIIEGDTLYISTHANELYRFDKLQ